MSKILVLQNLPTSNIRETTPHSPFELFDNDYNPVGLTLKKLVNETWKTVGNENFVPSDDRIETLF